MLNQDTIPIDEVMITNREDEQHVYFTIREFEELVKKHGVGFVLSKLEASSFDIIYDYYWDLDANKM